MSLGRAVGSTETEEEHTAMRRPCAMTGACAGGLGMDMTKGSRDDRGSNPSGGRRRQTRELVAAVGKDNNHLQGFGAAGCG